MIFKKERYKFSDSSLLNVKISHFSDILRPNNLSNNLENKQMWNKRIVLYMKKHLRSFVFFIFF